MYDKDSHFNWSIHKAKLISSLLSKMYIMHARGLSKNLASGVLKITDISFCKIILCAKVSVIPINNPLGS